MKCCVILSLVLVFAFGLLWGMLELILKLDWKYLFVKKKRKKKELSGNNIEDEYEGLGWYISWYLILNGFTSLITFYFLKLLENESFSNISTVEVSDILIAGFGGVVLLRSSLMTISIKNKDVVIGLVSVVESLMSKISLKMNQNIAAKRMCDIYEIMKDVDFDKARDELSILCTRYIDYFPEEDQKRLADAINNIGTTGLDNVNKSLQLGREIARYCDVEILKRAVKKLPHIKVREKNQFNESGDEDMDDYESRIKKLSEIWNQKGK